MPTTVADVNENFPELLKANECIAAKTKPAVRLFDEFWREGELALLFGAAGTGKSLLAVQIADALSRGTPMHGFVMPRGRRKVLYVDLGLSDAQFRERYSGNADVHVRNNKKEELRTRMSAFRFPQNLYRGRPKREADLCSWIKAAVDANDFRVVIVDDLTAVKRTHDGIRETLALMRGLKRLCGELGISILALSDAMEPTEGWASERDLQRSRVLCTVADSVFCIGKMRRAEDGRRIFQTRSRPARLVWTESNCPEAEIKHFESGLLGFEFDERFSPEIDEKLQRRLGLIKVLRDSGKTFRSIAATLGLSKSTVHEFWKKWSPMAERLAVDSCDLLVEEKGGTATPAPRGHPEADRAVMERETLDEDDDWDETEISDTADLWLSEEGLSEPPAVAGGLTQPEVTVTSNESNGDVQPSATAGGSDLRSIYDLEIEYNSYHEPIYVESRDEHTRRPMVWYQQFPEGTRRFQRMPFSIQVQHLNTGPFL